MDPVSLFLRKLLERVNIERDAHVQNLTHGQGITEIAQYREKVGYLRALHDIHGWCDDVYKELMRPDDEQPNPNRAIPQHVADRVGRVRPLYEGPRR